MVYVYPINPCPAPRQVGRDAWNPSPPVLRYRAFRDECTLRGVAIPLEFHHAIFVLQMPATWSARKRAEHEGRRHQSKPDRDNLEKALLDACCPSDAHIWNGQTTKLWGARGLIIVSDRALPIAEPLDLTPFYKAADERFAQVRGFEYPASSPSPL